jgi:hypothetical protein
MMNREERQMVRKAGGIRKLMADVEKFFVGDLGMGEAFDADMRRKAPPRALLPATATTAAAEAVALPRTAAPTFDVPAPTPDAPPNTTELLRPASFPVASPSPLPLPAVKEIRHEIKAAAAARTTATAHATQKQPWEMRRLVYCCCAALLVFSIMLVALAAGNRWTSSMGAVVLAVVCLTHGFLAGSRSLEQLRAHADKWHKLE